MVFITQDFQKVLKKELSLVILKSQPNRPGPASADSSYHFFKLANLIFFWCTFIVYAEVLFWYIKDYYNYF